MERTNGSALQYSLVRPALAESDLTSVAPYMFWLMFRNVASAGFVFEDPVHQGVLSQPGRVLASPSWANGVTQTSQDYVYNWTRDAAVVAIELAAGPALQTLAILQLFGQLDEPTQQTASAVINANLAFLQNAYQGATYNIWEEEYGASFFARSIQLRCFQAIAVNKAGIEVPNWLTAAIAWLQNILPSHRNGQYYQSLLPPPTDSKAP